MSNIFGQIIHIVLDNVAGKNCKTGQIFIFPTFSPSKNTQCKYKCVNISFRPTFVFPVGISDRLWFSESVLAYLDVFPFVSAKSFKIFEPFVIDLLWLNLNSTSKYYDSFQFFFFQSSEKFFQRNNLDLFFYINFEFSLRPIVWFL